MMRIQWKATGWAAFVLCGVLSTAGSVASADTIFDVNATVGDIFGTSNPSLYTGLTVTGTLDINTVTGSFDGLTVNVQGDPNMFTGFLMDNPEACPPECVFVFNDSFVEFGLLGLTPAGPNPLVGYTGGPLLAGSYIALDTPVLGSGDPEVQYNLSGTVTATPEPRYYTGLLGLAMIGSFLLIRRRRRA